MVLIPFKCRIIEACTQELKDARHFFLSTSLSNACTNYSTRLIEVEAARRLNAAKSAMGDNKFSIR